MTSQPKMNNRPGPTMYDVAVGPAYLLFLGVPLLIIFIVVLITFFTVRLIRRAIRARKNAAGLANQAKPDSQDNHE